MPVLSLWLRSSSLEQLVQCDLRDENTPSYPDAGDLTSGDCLVGKRTGDAKGFCRLFDREGKSLDWLPRFCLFGSAALDVKVEPRCNVFGIAECVRVLLPPVLGESSR